MLALAAETLGVEAPEAWRRALTESIVTWLAVDEAAQRVGATLDAAGVGWVPIKGYDVATRFYAEREARPVADLDLLVEPGELGRARAALEAAGWRGLAAGDRQESYLREEGYAWQAGGGAPAVIELHYRLWGLAPERLGRSMLAEAVPGPPSDSGSATGRRLPPAHAYLLAAVHAWTKERPRGLLDWLDLEHIASKSQADSAPQQEGGTSREEGGTWGEGVVEAAREWALELPVALSAAVGGRLWPRGVHGEIAAALEPRLTRWERRVLDGLAAGGPDRIAYRDVVLARLLSRRESRMGWRSVWRRLWPHPGVVAQRTPAEWSWARRRGASLFRIR